MRLARLTLNGFKSFADRTEFSFDDPMTGIVGPNGCGKSNVVDAIKWVLGERSSKSLRGKEMIDVIFAGSAARKPSGMASVCLGFDNPILSDAQLAAMRGVTTAEFTASLEATLEEGPAAASPTEAAATAEPESAEGVEGTESISATESTETESTETESTETIACEATGKIPQLADDEHARPRVELPAINPDDSDAESPIDRRAAARRGLPIDADVVEVERRLYRDGKSEYRINGRRARLKDIRDLFLDTGIGADAYSIIEQGKVDAMLLASPQERRNIFEEAAGIARYKQRRIESQRKLEKAEQNLALTRQHLENTDRRLRMVKGQAAKARRFVELDEEYKALRVAVAFEQYDDLRTRIEGLTSRLSDLESVRREARMEVDELGIRREQAELERGEIESASRRADEDRIRAVHAHERANERKAAAERAVAEALRQAEISRSKLKENEGRVSTCEASIRDLQEEVTTLETRVAEAEAALTEASRARAAAAESASELASTVSQRRNAVAVADRQRAAAAAAYETDERRLKQLESTRSELVTKRDALDKEQANALSGREELVAQVDRLSVSVHGLEKDLADREAQAASAGDDRAVLISQISATEQVVARMDSRRQTLQELVDSRVGLGDATRAVLDAKERGEGFSRVIAPLAEMIATGSDHAAMVEWALGESLRGLVIDAIDALPDEALRGSLPGRVTFLPMARLGSSGPRSVLDPSSILGGRVQSARRMVRPSMALHDPLHERIATLLDRLLEDTFVVPDLDSALLLAGGPLSGKRLVCRDGAVLEPDGRIVAGPIADASVGGVLQQRSELELLGRELATHMAELADLRAHLHSLDERAAGIERQAGETRRMLAEQQRELATTRSRSDRVEAELAHLGRSLADLIERFEQHDERVASLHADRESQMQRLEALDKRLADESAGLEALEFEHAAVAKEAQQAGELANSHRVEVGKLHEMLRSSRRELARAQSDLDQLARQRAESQQLLGELDSKLASERAVIAQAEQAAADSLAQAQEHGALAQEASERLGEVRDRVIAIHDEMAARREHAETIERDWHALERSRRELEIRRETLEERAREDLSLDVELEYDDFRLTFAPGDIERIDPEAVQPRIEELRAEIRRLGNVNLDSIVEEQTLEERNDDLIRQVDDLDAARVQLTGLIDQLNNLSTQRFADSFAAIQQQFGGPDGMFRKLFGGGRAEVRLMPLVKTIDGPNGPEKVSTDVIDVLESGIEVIAKPPGKEPRQISQLSGGEKTLTAVALLLSIFRSKPSCFCVLDEVDAALDDANVERLARTIAQFTDLSHFIVITHNKRSMQAMDRLYGVTMQERGVSTRVTVKFDHVNEDGSLKPKAIEQQEAAEQPSAGEVEEAHEQPVRKRGPVAEALSRMREEQAGRVAEHEAVAADN